MILSAIFAAAPLALFVGDRGRSEIPFRENHAVASVDAGGAFQAGQTWADGARIEAVRHDVYFALIAEGYWRPTHVQYATVRGGYLFHPRRVRF